MQRESTAPGAVERVDRPERSVMADGDADGVAALEPSGDFSRSDTEQLRLLGIYPE